MYNGSGLKIGEPSSNSSRSPYKHLPENTIENDINSPLFPVRFCVQKSILSQRKSHTIQKYD